MSRAGLTRDRVVRHALGIADAEGLAAVSFRRLAAELGVTPMALYRHVASREDLLTAMADLVLEEIQLPQGHHDGREDWAATLRGVLRSALSAYSRHPAARALSSSPRLSARSGRLTEALIQLLTGAGFTEREGLIIVQRLSDAALAPIWAPAGPAAHGLPGLEAALQETTPDDPREFGIDVVIVGAQALASQRQAANSPTPRTTAHVPRPRTDR